MSRHQFDDSDSVLAAPFEIKLTSTQTIRAQQELSFMEALGMIEATTNIMNAHEDKTEIERAVMIMKDVLRFSQEDAEMYVSKRGPSKVPILVAYFLVQCLAETKTRVIRGTPLYKALVFLYGENELSETLEIIEPTQVDLPTTTPPKLDLLTEAGTKATKRKLKK